VGRLERKLLASGDVVEDNTTDCECSKLVAGDHSGLLTGNIFYRIAAKRVKLATRPALRPPWFLQVLAQCYLETAIMIQNHATELLNTVYNGHIAKMEMLEVV